MKSGPETAAFRIPDEIDVRDLILVERVRGGEECAFEDLQDRFRGHARKLTKLYRAPGLEVPDIFQEAWFGLAKGVRDYDPENDTSFRTFGKLTMERQVQTAVTNARRRKHGPLNFSERFLSKEESEDTDGVIEEALLDRSQPGPFERFVQRTELDLLVEIVTGQLSEIECETTRLVAEGLSYREAGEALGVPKKTVDNACQRAQKKIRSAMLDTGWYTESV